MVKNFIKHIRYNHFLIKLIILNFLFVLFYFPCNQIEPNLIFLVNESCQSQTILDFHLVRTTWYIHNVNEKNALFFLINRKKKIVHLDPKKHSTYTRSMAKRCFIFIINRKR